MEEIRNQLHLIYLNRLKSLPFITRKVAMAWISLCGVAKMILLLRLFHKGNGMGVPPQLGFSETTERWEIGKQFHHFPAEVVFFQVHVFKSMTFTWFYHVLSHMPCYIPSVPMMLHEPQPCPFFPLLSATTYPATGLLKSPQTELCWADPSNTFCTHPKNCWL